MEDPTRENGGSEKEKGDAAHSSLQMYASTLANIILAGRMVNGVTVSLSVKNPDPKSDRAIIAASITAVQGFRREEQVDYARIHLKHVEQASTEAQGDLVKALDKAAQAKAAGSN